jgi:SulP family sulfate permease
MLVFVVALGPVLSAVPIPALAGLLILAGFGSLKPRALARSWQTSRSSGAAALITMGATLLVPIHIAVLIGVILSLLLVGITGVSSTHVVALEPAGPGRWRRAAIPTELAAGQVTVLDIEDAGAFVSVPALFDQLPAAPGDADRSGEQHFAVVLRLRGHLRTHLTFTMALEAYAEQIAGSGGSLSVCGLQPATITQLRAAGLPESIPLIAQGEETDGSLAIAYARAGDWLTESRSQPPPEAV